MYDPTKPFKHQILKLIKSTWAAGRKHHLIGQTGIYPNFKKDANYWKDYTEIDHTDGLGTKGLLHWRLRSFKEAVQDALAMNFNDLLIIGAVPYKLQSHLMLPEDDHDAVIEIISELVKQSKFYECIVTGGETAILNTIRGMEIGVCVSGKVKKDELIKPNVKDGDLIIGIESNGVHSNGMTRIRKVLEEKKIDVNSRLVKDIIKPTHIYVHALNDVFKKHKKNITGMMHITGGAFTKLKDVIGKHDCIIRPLKPQQIFRFLYSTGISDEEMYKTFNCGTGFVIICDKEKAAKIKKIINNYFKAEIIGKIIKGNGRVVVNSMFSDEKVVYQ